jgi:omega-amidase
MQLSGLQYDVAWENQAGNFDTVRRWVDRHDFSPGGLLVLPEMFSTGFSMDVSAVAEKDPSLVEAFLADLAVQTDSVVVGGLVTEKSNGRGLNESLAVSPSGEHLARYQKIRTFTYTGESDHYDRGTELAMFQWQGWKVCPLICYDLRFPEIFRRGIGEGAELFVVIASWPARRVEHWLTLLRARAIENQAYLVGVNRTGEDPAWPYPGRSVIIDPQGEIISDAGNQDGWVSAEIDRQVMLDWRAEFPALDDRLV